MKSKEELEEIITINIQQISEASKTVSNTRKFFSIAKKYSIAEYLRELRSAGGSSLEQYSCSVYDIVDRFFEPRMKTIYDPMRCAACSYVILYDSTVSMNIL